MLHEEIQELLRCDYSPPAGMLMSRLAPYEWRAWASGRDVDDGRITLVTIELSAYVGCGKVTKHSACANLSALTLAHDKQKISVYCEARRLFNLVSNAVAGA